MDISTLQTYPQASLPAFSSPGWTVGKNHKLDTRGRQASGFKARAEVYNVIKHNQFLLVSFFEDN